MNADNASIEYYEIQCANCAGTFVWHQAYWQSSTPGSEDPSGHDGLSRAFCPHCGAIVCEGIGPSYWKWYRENQRLNANSPLPPVLPSDLEWIPDNRDGQEFMKEFHQKWGKRQLPKELRVPVSQQRLDLTSVKDFKEAPFPLQKARPHKVFKEEVGLHEKAGRRSTTSTNDNGETYQEQARQDSEVLPKGWSHATPEERAFFWDELQIELPKGHILFHKPVRVIARLGGEMDDILCNHLDEPDRYTVVHLTWSMKKETNAKFPAVEIDGSFADFQSYEERSG